jgi:hypothetical protein
MGRNDPYDLNNPCLEAECELGVLGHHLRPPERNLPANWQLSLVVGTAMRMRAIQDEVLEGEDR